VVDDPVSTMSADIPSFYGPALDGWLRVVDEVHEAGGKIMPQLWHVGMARNPAKAPHPELPSAGPSGLTMPGLPGLTQPGLQHSEPMTREHIRRVVEAASLLGAGIRGLRPEPRRLDQEAYRQTHRHRRQRRAVRRRHRLVARRIFQGHRDRRPARPAGARRAAALRARGARDTVLTPRAPESRRKRGARIGPIGAIHPYPVWDQPRRT
jgi:hypothetical protein